MCVLIKRWAVVIIAFVILGCGLYVLSCGNGKNGSDEMDGGENIDSDTNTTASIAQNGITWYFDKEYRFGTYANGDFWVVGPVTIVRITPEIELRVENLGGDICTGGYTDRDCNARCDAEYPGTAALCSISGAPDAQGDCLCQLGRNGWQVNPAVGSADSAFDSRVGHQAFDYRLMPQLPYTASSGESLVKAISREENLEDVRPSLTDATVLTVVDSVPQDQGNTLFRPPYVHNEKPNYRLDQLRIDFLPTLPLLDDMATLEQVAEHVKRVQLEHISGRAGMILRPQNHLYYYAPENGGRRAEVALRLMFDDAIEEKMPTLIYFVQAGIDLLHALKNGQQWGAGGGEYPGMKLMMLFAAVMLDDPDHIAMVKNFVSYEDESVRFGVNQQGLWGHEAKYSDQETAYWSDVVNEMIEGANPSRKTIYDPYGYIDGGTVPGTGYQICCSIQSFKGTSLALALMPILKEHWDFPELHNYVSRMVEQGTLAQPDPCAPPDPADIAANIGIEDTGSHYGITFGPDGNGGCILDQNPSDGIGRFPNQDGVEQDPQSFHGSSKLVHDMWTVYR